MSDLDEYYEHEEPAPDAIAGLTADVRINVPPLDLQTPVGHRTLADLIVDTALDRLTKTAGWTSLKDRVSTIRDEEIRAAAKEQIASIFTEGFQATNRFGEPTGQPTTLRAVIAERAQKILDERKDNYSNAKTLREIINEEIAKAMKAELAEVVEAEKKKIVAAVRGQASALITQAVTAAITQTR